MRVHIQQLSFDCHQDGVIIVNVNRTSVKVRFIKVVENTIYDDFTKSFKDLKKVFKCKYIYNLIRHIYNRLTHFF